MLPHQEPRVSKKQEEIHTGTIPDYGLLRFPGQLCNNGDKAPSDKMKSTRTVLEIRETCCGFSLFISTISWKNEWHFTCNPPPPSPSVIATYR